MKNIILIFLLIVFGSTFISAQPPSLSWVKLIGSQGHDHSCGFVTDPEGFHFLAITFERTLEININNQPVSIIPKGGNDAAIVKINPAGEAVALWRLSNHGHIAVTDIALFQGKIHLSGSFQDTLFYTGNNNATNRILITDRELSAFQITITAGGQMFQARKLDETAIRSTYNYLSESNGRMIGAGTRVADSAAPEMNIVRVRRNQNESVYTVGPLSKMQIRGTAIFNNKYLFYGSFSDTLNLGQATAISISCADAFLAILDNANTPVYNLIAYHSLQHAEVVSAVQQQQHLWVAINFSDTLRIQATPPLEVVALGGSDVMILKYNASLNLVDHYHLGGPLAERADKLMVVNNKLYLFSNLSSPVSIIRRHNNITLQIEQENIRGNAALISIDAAGNCDLVWMVSQDWMLCIVGINKINDSETILAGVFYDTMEIDSDTYHAVGGQDVFFVRTTDLCLNSLKNQRHDLSFCEGDSVFIHHFEPDAKGMLVPGKNTRDGFYISKPGKYWVEFTLPCGCKAADTLNFVMIGPHSVNTGPRPDMTARTIYLNSAAQGMKITYCGECKLLTGQESYWITVTPNPFRTKTVVEFFMPGEGSISMNMLQMSGQPIVSVSQKQYQRGIHSIELNTSGIPPGLYMLSITLQQGDKTNQEVRKIVKL
ncbi:MAG: T9SS type A sorting domain-containing protein [Bacteroidales bacterium]|nr:T9SS type A sorting domain-containing protein [Bacteroidales bacterium]MDZ4205330.1 T9SS type A sorting domain-containing protein [Bacteroidales bacterium]